MKETPTFGLSKANLKISLLQDNEGNVWGFAAMPGNRAQYPVKFFCEQFPDRFGENSFVVRIEGHQLVFDSSHDRGMKWQTELSEEQSRALQKLFKDGNAYKSEKYLAERLENAGKIGFIFISYAYIKKCLDALTKVS